MDTTENTDFDVQEKLSFDHFKQEVLKDYRIVCESREASLLGRKEVLTGKAKFGIFGGGKEVAQVAMAKFFMPGDFRAGYYRDQTFMFSTGLATIEQFFSQLYSDTDINNDPFSAGRQMNAHFATKFVDENGDWLPLATKKNITADIAPTAGQMPRALGLALASKLFREVDALREMKELSSNGNEVCFCTIGDASTSEGHFWETINAAGVQQIPLAVFVWDDGYGISVPREIQTTKSSISEALSGLQKEDNTNGINIYKLKGWDYAGMCEVLEEAIQNIRDTHTPALFHVEELTQPQGHSTSGSHERYKSPERLEWEKIWDCKKQMKDWLISNALAEEEELDTIETEARVFVKKSRNSAWEKYITPRREKLQKAISLLEKVAGEEGYNNLLRGFINDLKSNREPLRRDIMKTLAGAADITKLPAGQKQLTDYYEDLKKEYEQVYDSYLYNEGPKSAFKSSYCGSDLQRKP